MAEFFLEVVNMSISASWIVLAVLLFRFLLKKAPKWINVLLWGIVAVRLICPFSFESALSLIPSSQTINPEVALNQPVINSGMSVIDNVINPIISETTLSFQPEKDINFFQFIMPFLAELWFVGVAALLIYTLVSFLRLQSKIDTAVLLRDNIFQSENVVSPYVLGLVKPKIYLPFNINGQDMEHVIAHEQAHIQRKDYLWKPLGFMILTLHWFNPLVWLGYVMLCRDIELACDEKVVKEFNNEQRADYSQALLTCSVNRRMIAACPLAFGEIGVKNRVKTVLNYKKPAFWVAAIAFIAVIVVALCFLTNPVSKTNLTAVQGYYKSEQIIYNESKLKDLPEKVYFITDEYELKVFSDNSLLHLGKMKETNTDAEYIKIFAKNNSAWLSDYDFNKITASYRVSLSEEPVMTKDYLIMMTESDDVLLAVFEPDEETDNGTVRITSIEKLKFYDENSFNYEVNTTLVEDEKDV